MILRMSGGPAAPSLAVAGFIAIVAPPAALTHADARILSGDSIVTAVQAPCERTAATSWARDTEAHRHEIGRRIRSAGQADYSAAFRS